MRARFIKGDTPYDSLGVGRVDERRKGKILKTLKDIVAEYDLDPTLIKDNQKEADKRNQNSLIQEIEFQTNNGYLIYLGWLDKTEEWYFGVETLRNKNQEGDRSKDFDFAVETLKRWVRKYNSNPVEESQHFTREENPLDSLNIGRVKERKFEAAKENIKSLIGRYFYLYGDLKRNPYESIGEESYVAGFWSSKTNSEFLLAYNNEDEKFTVKMVPNENISISMTGSTIQYHKKILGECLPILNKWLKNF